MHTREGVKKRRLAAETAKGEEKSAVSSPLPSTRSQGIGSAWGWAQRCHPRTQRGAVKAAPASEHSAGITDFPSASLSLPVSSFSAFAKQIWTLGKNFVAGHRYSGQGKEEAE